MRLAGRNPRELAFRARQAVGNLKIWAVPPGLGEDVIPAQLSLSLPTDIGSTFRSALVALADQIIDHRLPFFNGTLDVGTTIEWRRDYVHGKTSDLRYFRFVPYLDFEAVGDHKNIWELSRHQHLVVLAQAFFLTAELKYRDEIEVELESWWNQNPFLRGINWTSALEVAFRALSWIWVDHLTGEALSAITRKRLLNSLYQHGAFLECNLSTYFSPNTHLLGEGVALHAIGLRLKQESWRAAGAKVVEEELVHQVAPDGSHFEQSTYYHVYALDFFVFHYLLSGRPKFYEPVLRKMAHFLAAIVGPERLLTFFGDDDGGRLFHPYGPRELFARATLATASVLFPDENLPRTNDDLTPQAKWWIGCGDMDVASGSSITCRFPNSGLVSIAGRTTHILVDTGAFGFGGAGHSHADTLSITVRSGDRELLIDPGTFTYISDATLRNMFRGTGSHNTIRINGLDQADAAGPFRWQNKPEVQTNQWRVESQSAYLDASCFYRGVVHRRRLLYIEDEWLFVLDEIGGSEGEHKVEQFWHLGDSGVKVLVSDPQAAKLVEGLRSRVLGQKEVSPVICSTWTTRLPHLCGAALPLRGQSGELKRNGTTLQILEVISVAFREFGMPEVTRP